MIFSIIIPVYNVEKYLRECLDSVVRQSFADWEAICVNDGSTDNSAEVLEDYAAKDSRFKVVTQANGGLSAARNTGLKHATGDYVLFLDSDDWLGENALQVLSERIAGQDLVCFNGQRYFESTSSFEDADTLEAADYGNGWEYYNHNALLSRHFAFVCVVLRLYRRAFLLQNDLWFKTGIYHEDNHFTPRACYFAQGVTVMPDVLYYYRVRPNSITTSSDFKHKRDMMLIANDLAGFFISKTSIDKTVVYRAITHHYQVAFENTAKDERKELEQLCDWRLYRAVSRTKLRHQVNYWKNRIGK